MDTYKKLYKEALEVAKRKLCMDKAGMEDVFTPDDIREIFPELKESEDERIRKALIKFHKSTIDIDGIKGGDILAWLEKQGKHANFRNKIQIGDKVTRNEDGVLVNLSQLKRVAKKDEIQEAFKAGAKWQKEHLWKYADGRELPEIDRDVICLLDCGKVVKAYRPSTKNNLYVPETYEKGGWSYPNIKYWLDVELPKEIEL